MASRFGFSFAVLTAFVVSSNSEAVAQYIGSDSPVGVPRFLLRDGTNIEAGKAFGISWLNRRKLLLCPIHLLGPCGGYDVQIQGREVPDKIASVEVLDPQSENVIAKASRGVLRTGDTETNNAADDLTAFELESNNRMPLLSLCLSVEPVGARVWVFSKDSGGNNLQADRFPGKIRELANGKIVVDMDRKLTATGSSDAPILNAKNEVVGMMTHTVGDNRMAFSGVSSAGIYARLYRELPR